MGDRPLQTVDKVAKPCRAITRNFFRHIVGQGLALAEIESKTTLIEKWIERNVQSTFGAFRLLLGGSTNVQHPLTKYEIYLTFSKSDSV